MKQRVTVTSMRSRLPTNYIDQLPNDVTLGPSTKPPNASGILVAFLSDHDPVSRKSIPVADFLVRENVLLRVITQNFGMFLSNAGKSNPGSRELTNVRLRAVLPHWIFRASTKSQPASGPTAGIFATPCSLLL